MFTTKGAAAAAKKFRRRGLTGTALDLATAISKSSPLKGSVLEVGGGVGQIHLTLLRNGEATTALNVELSRNWETKARKLIGELGLEGRVERIIGDFVSEGRNLARADAVILHRVVCCYPDWRAMLEAALSKANRMLGLTFPIDRSWVKAMVGLGNQVMRLRREPFRAYVHPTDLMLGLVRSHGFEITSDRSGLVWRTVIARRG
ncbi:MAG: hypothetical protein ACR2NT_01650 [Acidimicrobiia bacterium]|nr:hypothetical protein [Acidimicrobiia bacterium]MDQ3501968.1 class I SAM-dependent methyltransferase [Actinomycetota bacterium]